MYMHTLILCLTAKGTRMEMKNSKRAKNLPRAHQSTALVWPAPVMISCKELYSKGQST